MENTAPLPDPPPPPAPAPPPTPPSPRPDKALRWAVIGAYIAINAIVFYNARRHDPGIGYDSDAHLHYMMALSHGRLPTSGDTGEFFSPPLPYVPGAIALAMGHGLECSFKIAQYAQFAFSLVLTFFLLQLCGLIKKDDDRLGLIALLCLGMIPAYYKTFAMIRGEPLLATLAVVIAWLAVRTFVAKERMSVIAAIVLGLLLGAAAISRQWGIFLIPPVVLLGAWRMRRDGKFWPAFRTLAIAGLFCAISGSWYYLHLHRTYGSMTAFNRSKETIDRPLGFYIGFPVARVISKPIRPDEARRWVLPILYCDTWGDYWMHFLIYGENRRGRYTQGNYITSERVPPYRRAVRTNMHQIRPYLRRINALSLLPTAVMLAGLGYGVMTIVRLLRTSPLPADQRLADVPALTVAFATLIVVSTMSGYYWFLKNYTDTNGDTIKASYILQTMPFAALMGAVLLRRLLERWPRATTVLIVLLIGVTAHNAPAMVTRYRRNSDHVCRESSTTLPTTMDADSD
jgi:4-amino-4-deoxy-L-arabinose transferase-like glycosyltransferase